MKPAPLHPNSAPLARAFTLIEVMVVVVLMSVVILGLTAMFVQTQRAFKAGMTQTDVLEGGRMATEMFSRELEQIVPTYAVTNAFNNGGVNFQSYHQAQFPQALPANTARRTNAIGPVFFITHENQTWTGIGYYVVPDDTVTPTWPVGALNRFELSLNAAQFAAFPWLIHSNFNNALAGLPYIGNVSKVLDGVISFNFRAYDTNGYWINPDRFDAATNYTFWSVLPGRADYQFTTKAVPASVEFELGLLEQGTFDRYRSFPVSLNQSNYLFQQVGRVHLFRQRVTVRNVDATAY